VVAEFQKARDGRQHGEGQKISGVGQENTQLAEDVRGDSPRKFLRGIARDYDGQADALDLGSNRVALAKAENSN
jgi:hypothetical protein